MRIFGFDLTFLRALASRAKSTGGPSPAQPPAATSREGPRDSLASAPLPFFARFLEEQRRPDRIPTAVTLRYPSDHEDGGGEPLRPGRPGELVTLKFPSDQEDGGGQPTEPGGGAVTLKFPSDNEDGGGGAVTLKFPSDNEDGGGQPIGPVKPGDVVTLKHPSDNEDGGVR
jgi:hypothetical protein